MNAQIETPVLSSSAAHDWRRPGWIVGDPDEPYTPEDRTVDGEVIRGVLSLYREYAAAGFYTPGGMLTEKGEMVNGRGDQPNRHDILTGSQLDGTALTGDPATTTCGNWTSSGEGSALLGHHDRQGGGTNPTSWNSAHPSRGCSQENLRGTGGDGFFYCFATN